MAVTKRLRKTENSFVLEGVWGRERSLSLTSHPNTTKSLTAGSKRK